MTDRTPVERVAQHHGRLRPVGDVELRHDLRHVMFHRFLVQIELSGNLLVAHSRGDEVQDLLFAPRQLGNEVGLGRCRIGQLPRQQLGGKGGGDIALA